MKPKKKFGATLTPGQRAILDAVKEACFEKDCKLKGVSKKECIACEKRGKAHVIHHCVVHAGEAMTAIKRHVLLKHPVNMLRVVVAGLRGENIE